MCENSCISSTECASSTLAPFLNPFFICRIREGLNRSSAVFWLCNELRTRSQLMGKYPFALKCLYPNSALSRLRNSIIKESRSTSVVRCSSISPNMASLSVVSSNRYSPVPYTSQRRTIEGGKSLLFVRIPASSLAIGFPLSVATINTGAYPGVASYIRNNSLE